jgi:TonB family protein
MFCRLLALAVTVLVVQGAEQPGPSEFHVVSVAFSDNGALFYYRVIDVTQEASGSVICYARIAPTNVFCPRTIVQAAEARVHDRSPAQLAGANNPCAIKPAALSATLKRFRQHGSVFETISFGIVAQCGSSSISLTLPDLEGVDVKKMEASNPAMVRLWELSSEITTLVFGSNDIFHERSEEEDLALQRAGQKLVPQLISGRYDKALAAAVDGNVGKWKEPTFRSLLASYHGPIPAADAKASYVPHLLNATDYRFASFVTPKYPALAMQARIQGEVELQLTVEMATGEVQNASVISGHPLLTPTAIEAAKQWRFDAHSLSADRIKVTIAYSLRCEQER